MGAGLEPGARRALITEEQAGPLDVSPRGTGPDDAVAANDRVCVIQDPGAESDVTGNGAIGREETSMAAYDTWLLALVAPVLWWLMAMVRAVVDVRARAVAVAERDGSREDMSSYR